MTVFDKSCRLMRGTGLPYPKTCQVTHEMWLYLALFMKAP